MSADKKWFAWNESWPGWKDAGRFVEAEYQDGSVFTGRLMVKDFFPDGQGDEVPVWSLFDGGNEKSFADCERFRYVP
jgi:hypothetical protein